MNKLLTTMAMAVITMLVMPISAFAQLSDGDKVNVFAISQQMSGGGKLSLVHMINVDNGMGVQNIDSMRNFDIQGGAVAAPQNQNTRQHFLTQAFAREDGNEQWNQIRFQDYDRNAIYTREFAVKTDCTIDFRIGSSGAADFEEVLPFARNGYTMLAADGSIFMSITIDDPRCSGPGEADSAAGEQGPQGKQGPAGADGSAGAAGATGADGAAGAAGEAGAAGADAPCVSCQDVANSAVALACAILGENPPANVQDIRDTADVIVTSLMISANICDLGNCDVGSEIDAVIANKLAE